MHYLKAATVLAALPVFAQTESPCISSAQRHAELRADYSRPVQNSHPSASRRITAEDLRRFIEDFFENSDYFGSSIKWNSPQNGMATIKLSF